ncbi:MAG: hypothetical protein WAX14_03695 [Rhodococcus sp. (in: high G+C Gram-positive bacteria)]|uniref:T3SS (YopN, CesT) and YbjN peptide-binding chaperone 1 n=1 Tax=Rhodococcus sp. TaxID=1831 RepID=UPI003BB49A38
MNKKTSKKNANRKNSAEKPGVDTVSDAQVPVEEQVPVETQWSVPVDTVSDDVLRDAVRQTLADVLDEAPEPDEDGDLPIWLGDVLTYASVDAEDAVVELRTFLVEQITGRTRAAEVLGDLQSEWPDFKFVLHKDRVTAEQRVPASPLVPLHLIRAVGAIVPLIDEVRLLASRLGGEACVFDGDDADSAGSPGALGESLLADENCGCGNCDCG